MQLYCLLCVIAFYNQEQNGFLFLMLSPIIEEKTRAKTLGMHIICMPLLELLILFLVRYLELVLSLFSPTVYTPVCDG